TAAAVLGQPAQAEGLTTGGADLQGDLVVGAADTAGLAFEVGHDVFHRLLEHFQRIIAGLFLHDVERIVNDLLGNALLAVQHDVVDKTGDYFGIVNRIGQNFAFCDITSSGHLSSLLHINDIIGTRKSRNSRCATKKAGPILWRKDVSLLLGTGLGALSTVFAAGLIAVRNTLGVQRATDDVVTDTGQKIGRAHV